MCATDAIPLAFLFGLYVSDSARYGLNKISLATISSVLKILSPEDFLINRFFAYSTSLISLSDPNMYFWIRSTIARIYSEKI